MGEKPLGGIDLDVRNLDLKETGEKMPFNFPIADPALFNPANINAVVPVIINITPLPNLYPSLGMVDPNHPTETAREPTQKICWLILKTNKKGIRKIVCLFIFKSNAFFNYSSAPLKT